MPLSPGFSCLPQSTGSLDLAQNTLSAATEELLGGGATDPACGAIPWNWPQLGGSSVRVGVAGLFTVTTTAITVRLRLGGAPASSSGTPAGTIVKTFTVPVGSNQVVDQLSDPVAIPGVLSYLQVTVESAGSAGVTVTRLTPYILPDAKMQVLPLVIATDMNHSGADEIVRAQWPVDFDKFDSANVRLALAGRSFQAVGVTGRYRLRWGGTFGVADGTSIFSYDRGSDTGGDGTLSGQAATIAKPSGIQLVKLSVQSLDGFPCSMRSASVLVKGVA